MTDPRRPLISDELKMAADMPYSCRQHMTETMYTRDKIDQNELRARKGACAAVFIDVEHQDGICVLRITGRFATGADLDYLRGKLDQIRRLRSRWVLADFTEVVSMGSTGLNFLLNLYWMVTRESGGRFILAGANPLVRTVLDLTRVSEIIPIAENLDSVLQRCVQRRASAMNP